MGDLIVRPGNFEELPELARKKWLESQIQEKKSMMFRQKQQLDACEQEIEDIREGKMKKIQYSMLCLGEDIKKFQQELNQVVIT